MRIKAPPEYIAKVPRFNPFLRVAWWITRRYCLNVDRYRLVKRYTGPRPRGTNQSSTLKKNATAYRFYLETRDRYKPRPQLVHCVGATERVPGTRNGVRFVNQ